jgi:hypothetical protein
MRTRPILSWGLVLATTSCAIVANLGDRTLGDPYSDGDGGGGPGDDGSPGDDGGPSDGGGGDVVYPPFDAPPGCVIDTSPASLLPAQVYLAVDISASMGEPLPDGGSKFVVERTAVDDFTHEPLSAPLYVTMGTHPSLADAGCDPGVYANPPVALGQLGAGNADLITTYLKQIPVPVGQSPWSPMLQGAVARATSAQQQAPGRVTAIVFIADNAPTTCDLSAPDLQAVVAGAAKGTPPIRTFAIGFVDSTTAVDVVTFFDPIAQAGGTGKSFSPLPQSVATVQGALDTIRDDVACNLKLPQVGGKVADLSNGVLYFHTPAGNVPLAAVAGAAACAKADAYYPDAIPETVHLCPAACARLLTDPQLPALVTSCKP